METYSVPKPLLEGIYKYLAARPFIEVADAMIELAKIMEPPAPVAPTPPDEEVPNP